MRFFNVLKVSLQLELFHSEIIEKIEQAVPKFGAVFLDHPIPTQQ